MTVQPTTTPIITPTETPTNMPTPTGTLKKASIEKTVTIDNKTPNAQKAKVVKKAGFGSSLPKTGVMSYAIILGIGSVVFGAGAVIFKKKQKFKM